MVRLTCQAALGFGCAASAPAPTCAAAWSFAPIASVGVDDDSNRVYTYPALASQGSWVDASAQFERTTEITQLTLDPHVRWEHFYTQALSDILDLNLAGTLSWTGERQVVNVNASVFNESTVTSELTETGIARNDLRRLTEQGSVAWSYSQTELRALVVQGAYVDTTYHGPQSGLTDLLQGYRYPTASVGERFALSERSSITASAFGDALLTSIPGGDSHEAGGQLELVHAFSERTQLDVAAGGSSQNLRGNRSTGTVATFDLSHSMSRGKVSIDYSRRLTPYGTGVLANRQQFTLYGDYGFSEKVDADVSLLRIQNSESIVLLGIDRRNYTGLTLGLNWRPRETWSIRIEGGGTQTQTTGLFPHPVNERRAALSVSWSPKAWVHQG